MKHEDSSTNRSSALSKPKARFPWEKVLKGVFWAVKAGLGLYKVWLKVTEHLMD